MRTTSLLVAETSGNQQYIYRSNRLREAVGASHLITSVGTTWLSQAIIEAVNAQVTKVVATSGKAILLGDGARLREIARLLTMRVLTEAPGLELAVGVVDLNEGETFFGALRRGFAKAATNRASLNGPDARYQRLPIVGSCESSGAVAHVVDRVAGRNVALSLEASTKRAAARHGLAAIREAVRASEASRLLANSVDDLDDEVGGQWLGVVHADGNGLGQLFLSFDRHLEATGRHDVLADVRRSAEAYRGLSEAVEQCTRASFAEALRRVESTMQRNGDTRSQVVPVLLGGDDLTLVASGAIALDLARFHVETFALATAQDDTLRDLGVGGLTASASVVYTKPHFPYWASYAMASDLLGAAKETVRSVTPPKDSPASVVDIHMVYDSSADSIDSLRSQHVTPNGGVRLWGGPYGLDDSGPFPPIDSLRSLAGSLQKSAGISSSSVHDLRSRLTTLGLDAAQRRQREVAGLARIGSPTVSTPTGEAVMLLDAMDLNDVEGVAMR